MTQPPPGPWRPMGPLPPPQARPLPPRPTPVYGQTLPYGPPPGMPPGPPPGMLPGPPPGMPYQGGYPPRSTTPPWLQYPGPQYRLAPRKASNTGALVATLIVVVLIGAVATVGFLSMKGDENSVADTGYSSTPSSSYSSDTYSTTSYETTTTTTTTETTDTTEDTPTETTAQGPQPVYALEE